MKIIVSIVILSALSCGCEMQKKRDKIPPKVICQNISVTPDSIGIVTITPAMINNGSTDNQTNVEDLTLSLDKTTFNSSNIGDNQVTLTVTDKSGNFSNGTATVSVSKAVIAPSENDLRTLSWISPGKPWASYREGYGVQIDSHYNDFRLLSTIPEPGYLAHIKNVPQAGQYTLSRGNDPMDESKKAFYHRVTSSWDQFDPLASHTSRSEYDGGIERSDVFLEGEEYWYINAYCFDADCFGHKGYSIDLSDIHEQTWLPETPGAKLKGGVMNAIGLGDNHGGDTFTWDYSWVTGYPPVTGSPGSGEVNIPLQTSPVVPNVWYYVIRKIKLHYDASHNPYSMVWVAKGNGPLVLMHSRVGPNAYNLDNPRYFPKTGLYKWDQTWGSKPTRTLWTKGMYIFKAIAPTGNEPVINQNSLLLLLRTI